MDPVGSTETPPSVALLNSGSEPPTPGIIHSNPFRPPPKVEAGSSTKLVHVSSKKKKSYNNFIFY